MSADERRKLEVGATVVVALLSLVSALSALLLLPYRMTAAEAEIRSVKTERAIDHDILVRLDTTTASIKLAVERMENRDGQQQNSKP